MGRVVDSGSLSNGSVTYDKIQNISATDRILGRVSSGAGVVEEITFTDQAQQLAGDTSFGAMRTTLGFSAAAVQPIYECNMHSAGNASITMASMPAAAAFPSGTGGNRMVRKVDLTNYTQVRFLVTMNTTAGPTGSVMALRYLTSYSITPGNFLTIGASSTEVQCILTAASTCQDSGWTNLDAAAKGDVWIAPIGLNGDAATSPTVSSIIAQFR